MAKRWYVVHAYSGYEKHVMRSLIERVKLAGMEEDFGEILVPTEEVVEMRNGQKRKSERKFFPGYVLVQMEMNEGTWHLVKDTPRVMGFIGGTADKPAPITDKEAEAILRRVADSGDPTQFYFRTTDVTGSCELPEGVEMVMPGDNVKMVVTLIKPIAMEEGLRFAIREGGRTVGAGVVAKIVE